MSVEKRLSFGQGDPDIIQKLLVISGICEIKDDTTKLEHRPNEETLRGCQQYSVLVERLQLENIDALQNLDHQVLRISSTESPKLGTSLH